jgi:hypothetical protein
MGSEQMIGHMPCRRPMPPVPLAAWLDRPWIKAALKMTVDRQTFRLLDEVQKPSKRAASKRKPKQ